jgi:hypothetical protein
LESTFKRAAAAMIQSGITNLLTGGQEGTSFAAMFGNISKSFGGGRATGGPVDPSKFYMVGERGPELFQPKVPGNIIPDHAMRGGGGGVTVIVNATDAVLTSTVKQWVAQGMQEAAQAGAAGGYQMAMRTATRRTL